ncbi:MAG TPA: IPT/TIG domain-containing protein [Bryobacteraceae bacterium]|nr:IPT/TIG domain-containing protein [Bryobacteraceae bacterium]
MFQSTDGGKTWHVISALIGAFNNVVIDARNGNIYAAGVDPGGPAPLFFKSADGGKTWAPMVKGMPKRLGAEVHLDPEAATTLYAGQAANAFGGNTGPGGGVSVSTDSGASWTLSPVDAAAGANDVVLAMAVVSSIAGAPAPPAFSVNGVENGASFQPGIPANSWVTILGTNLATQTGDWSNAIVNGNLPTTLNGVSVSMGGMPAYIYYTSPGQLNVLAPDLAAGAVAVTVTTAAGTSSALTVTANPYGPAFFLWPGNQAVATRQDFSFAVKPGTFAATTVAAKPGDVLILWATGFGPTIPTAPAGVAVPGTNSYVTASAPTVSINNTPATVYGGALASGAVGLYQIAIQVPTTIADGDWPIQASIGGVTSPTGSILSVHK